MRKVSVLTRRPRLSRVLIFIFWLTCSTLVAFSQDVSLDFYIPEQALATALERYGEITGRNVLYNSNLVIGRRSTAVEGRLSPDAALKRLLNGTKLLVEQVTATSFTLLSAPSEVTPFPQSDVADYYGRIQIRLHHALCSAGPAQPGKYRIGMRLWIDGAGSITRYERLNSTGESRVDAAVDQALEHLKIGTRPPADLAQPVSVVIVRQGPGVTMSCTPPTLGRDGDVR